MDSREAREILLLYRPGTPDEMDPDFKEALATAQGDAELERWFKAHCAAQTVLRAKFAQIPIPDALKEQIVAEAKSHLGSRFGIPALLAGICMVLVILAISLAHFGSTGPKSDSLASFRNRMVGTVLRQYPEMDLETNNLAQIDQYLKKKGQSAYVLPGTLSSNAVATGCALISWHSRPVSMICFNSGKKISSGQPDLFLFIIDRAAIPDAPAAGSPQLARISRLTTATWTAGDKTYVLGGAGNEAFVRSFL